MSLSDAIKKRREKNELKDKLQALKYEVSALVSPEEVQDYIDDLLQEPPELQQQWLDYLRKKTE